MGRRSSLASAVGNGYAYLQHGIDKTIAWGFSAMRKATKEVDKAPDKSADAKAGIAKRAARMGRRTLFFLGEAGDAYFQKYEQLKQHAKSEKKEK